MIYTQTPQELIDMYRKVRDKYRPVECIRRSPCWVDQPYVAMSNKNAPHCETCKGLIRRPNAR